MRVDAVALLSLLLWLGPTHVGGQEGMFVDWGRALPKDPIQLNYGVAVTNVGNGDGPMEWVVAGFSGANLVLEYDQRTGNYRNLAQEDSAFAALRDEEGAAIGVCACDIDGDGLEEIYFLNTNNRYSGPKLVRDRLFKWRNNRYEDLFSDSVNQGVSSMYSGRSVACVDRTGSGKYGILLATYAQDNEGKFGLIEMNEYDPANDVRTGRIVLHNVAETVGIDFSTGGRGITVGPIIGDDGFSDAYFVNEGNGFLGNRGDNALFVNDGRGRFTNEAGRMMLNDSQPGRGVTVADLNNDGMIDIVYGNWMGPHRIQMQTTSSSGQPYFRNVATRDFETPSPIRTVIVADFDNSGTQEIFMNNIVYGNIDASNKLYHVLPQGDSVQVTRGDIGAALEPKKHGTGGAVADIDNDGVLELLVAHGESMSQGLTHYHVNPSKTNGNRWLRVLPLTQFGAPARGSKVILRLADGTRLTQIIDGGSGYLCEMEPVAHFGLGRFSEARAIEVTWPDNHKITKRLSEGDINSMFKISHTGNMERIAPSSASSTGRYSVESDPTNTGSSNTATNYQSVSRTRSAYGKRWEQTNPSRTTRRRQSNRGTYPNRSTRREVAKNRGSQRQNYRRRPDNGGQVALLDRRERPGRRQRRPGVNAWIKEEYEKRRREERRERRRQARLRQSREEAEKRRLEAIEREGRTRHAVGGRPKENEESEKRSRERRRQEELRKRRERRRYPEVDSWRQNELARRRQQQKHAREQQELHKRREEELEAERRRQEDVRLRHEEEMAARKQAEEDRKRRMEIDAYRRKEEAERQRREKMNRERYDDLERRQRERGRDNSARYYPSTRRQENRWGGSHDGMHSSRRRPSTDSGRESAPKINVDGRASERTSSSNRNRGYYARRAELDEAKSSRRVDLYRERSRDTEAELSRRWSNALKEKTHGNEDIGRNKVGVNNHHGGSAARQNERQISMSDWRNKRRWRSSRPQSLTQRRAGSSYEKRSESSAFHG